MLSNFQFGDQALLQSFLVGQPELRAMMQGPQMQQLRQRVIASYHLGPLDRSETQAYIEHRLKHVGWNSDPTFEPGCFDLIHELTGGIPRRINTLCNRAAARDVPRREARGRHGRRADDRPRDPRGDGRGRRAHADGGGAERMRARRPRARARTRVDPSVWHRHFHQIEERIDRLEATVGAAVDLLHTLLHPEKVSKPGPPKGR